MTSRPATSPALVPVCCARAMTAISVTEEASELALVSCASCGRHAWLRDGVLLDRDGMLAAVRERMAEAPRPKGGRPRGSGRRSVPSPRRTVETPDAVQAARLKRIEEMRGMLQGFEVLGGGPAS